MREIKFRIWTGSKMCYSEEGWSGSNGFVSVIEIYTKYEDSHEWNDYKLMQFTGLTDSKGVEIYEGDIITAEYGKGTVTWNETTLQFKYNFDIDSDALWYYKKIVVIGNIYESSNLLTTKT